MSEVPREEQPEEQHPPAPLVHSLGYGVGTFLAAGMVDLLAHLGPTGLVVGGIIAYAAARHGPELVEQVRETLPSPTSPQASRQRSNALSQQSGSQSKRTVLDRALGRFPAEEEDTIVVEEPEAIPPEPTRQTRRLFAEIAHPIRLSPDLVVEANDIVGAGINIFGVKGSGKTSAAARLAEQFARFRVCEVLFDLKGDLLSLVTDRRSDGRPFAPHGVVGVRGHAPRGRSVLSLGLQVVYDLRTWQTAEQMGNSVCVVVEELLETVALTPEGEEPAPCLVFLDEAEYWLPQAQPSYLSVHTYKRLLDAFHTLATMGRSRGLAPVIATQRIAKVNKDIIAQAEMHVFMKAMLDIDLDRYFDYFNKALVSREQLRGFQAGEAVVCLPDGSQAMNILEILVTLPSALSNIVLGTQVVMLDVGGFSLASMGEQARQQGDERAARKASVTGNFLIGVTIVTLLLVTIGLLWSAAKHDTDMAEKGLILVRVIMTVIYGHVIHSLRSVTTHRQHATFSEHLTELAARITESEQHITEQYAELVERTASELSAHFTELVALPGMFEQLQQTIEAQVHALIQQEVQTAIATHTEQHTERPNSGSQQNRQRQRGVRAALSQRNPNHAQHRHSAQGA